MATVLTTDLPGLTCLARGKVRDVYDLGDRLLIIATDRISAFDVVLPTAIPDKGRILTKLSLFWFRRLGDIVANHLIAGATVELPPELAERAMVVRKLRILPIECVARGYLAGGGWKDYQRTGKVSGIALAPGLREAERLAEPIFTPSTKAERGRHDEPISFAQTIAALGESTATRVRDLTLALYRAAAAHAATKGIIVADTKFEFGVADGEIILADEVLTPDSSRFWPLDGYRPGASPPSFDKQYVRDWLERDSGWNKTGPAPDLPGAVVERTRERYVRAYERLTGETFA
ncbi:MAG: phosphoribosylaminoimidazolesuccinocarboxamide synthase [Alphaproteobacteria bacterium]|nr:phosphoribosylaminoimidazolesuccinocarboxamide synthase [Alphaproteobacteria bacterium]